MGKTENNAQVKESLLKKVEGSEALEVYWWRTGADLPLLRFRKDYCEDNEIVKEELCSLQSRGPVFQVSSAEQSTVTLLLL